MEDQILAVRRMQDYIEAHLDEEISAADLADASHYSSWHANRLFRFWMNITPADYIRRLRLSRAALMLRDEEQKIIDVAYSVGFGSVDGFQRAFYKEFGCNPKEYSQSPIALYLFTPYRIQNVREQKEEAMEDKKISLQILNRPKRKVIIKRGIKAKDYYEYTQEVGCDVWGLLTSIRSISGEPVCMWLPGEYIKPGTSEYVQGVEVPLDDETVLPEGFEIIELPECEYLMFQGEPFNEENWEDAIRQIWEAEKEYDPAELGCRWDPDNPRIQLEPRGDRGYIELMPVKRIADAK